MLKKKYLKIFLFLLSLNLFLGTIFNPQFGFYFSNAKNINSLAVGFLTTVGIHVFLIPIVLLLFFLIGKILKKDWVNGFLITSIIFQLLILVIFFTK